jgi:hypothetical protein
MSRELTQDFAFSCQRGGVHTYEYLSPDVPSVIDVT